MTKPNTLATSVNKPLGGFNNKALNGDFEDWSKGTSFQLVGSSEITANHWMSDVGDGEGDITREEFIFGQTNVPNTPNYFFRHYQTAAASNSVTLDFLKNRIPGVEQFSGQKITISFYAKCNKEETFNIYVKQNFGSGTSASAPQTSSSQSFTLLTDWNPYEVTLEIPSVYGYTVDGEDNNLEIVFEPGFTSTFIFDIANVQMEEGQEASDFETRKNVFDVVSPRVIKTALGVDIVPEIRNHPSDNKILYVDPASVVVTDNSGLYDVIDFPGATLDIDSESSRADSQTLDEDTEYNVIVGINSEGKQDAILNKNNAKPTGWQWWRRVGSVFTDLSLLELRPFEKIDNFFYFLEPEPDYVNTSPISGDWYTVTLKAPANSVTQMYAKAVGNATEIIDVKLKPLIATDNPVWKAASYRDPNGDAKELETNVFRNVNSDSQIEISSTVAGSGTESLDQLELTAIGWYDNLGKENL